MEQHEPMAILRNQLAARNEAQERERRAAPSEPLGHGEAPASIVLTLDPPAARGLEALAESLGMAPTRLAEQLLQDAIVNRYGAPG
jgi:hypothetical protein